MRSILAELENDEAVLLMYAHGELSAEETAEVDRRLHGDAALRARLDEMTLLDMTSRSRVAQADVPLTLSRREAAARSASAAVRQWQVERATRKATSQYAPLGWRGRLAYGLAASAAVLVLAFGAWSMYQTDENDPANSNVQIASVTNVDGQVEALRQTEIIVPLLTPDYLSASSDTMLAAERQLLALQRLREVQQ